MTMELYDRESNSIQSQLIKELFNQVGMSKAYYTGHIYIFGENNDNDLGAVGIALYQIKYIDCDKDNIIITKTDCFSDTKITIQKPKILVTKGTLDCVYHCLYFCKTHVHEPEYADDDYYEGGFCMMSGEPKTSMFNDICKYFIKKEE